MFTPRELALERGWPGKIDGDQVIQVAAQTIEAFFTGGGTAREHAVYRLEDVDLRAPVLRPPSLRFFENEQTFTFGNTASIYGPGDTIRAPGDPESRFCIAAVIGADEQIGGYTIVTDYEPAGFRWEHARELAARNTRLRPGDVLVAPPFAVGVQAVDVPGLGALAV